MARCIKAIPNDTNIEFIIGLSNQTSSFLNIAEFDENRNKIKIFDLINFNNEEDDIKNISNVNDIYNVSQNLILTQLYDEDKNKNILTAVKFQRNDNGSINTDKELVKNTFLEYQDENAFE